MTFSDRLGWTANGIAMLVTGLIFWFFEATPFSVLFLASAACFWFAAYRERDRHVGPAKILPPGVGTWNDQVDAILADMDRIEVEGNRPPWRDRPSTVPPERKP